MPSIEVQPIAGLVEYQEGAIVSRVILKSPSGNVTLFAFDRGQALSEHKTPHDAFVLILDGRARIAVGDREHNLAVGDSLILPADQPHSAHAPERMKMLLVMIRG